MDWVCDDSWRPAAAQSIFFVGAIVGTVIFGYTADRYGRYWTFMASNFVVLITGLGKYFAMMLYYISAIYIYIYKFYIHTIIIYFYSYSVLCNKFSHICCGALLFWFSIQHVFHGVLCLGTWVCFCEQAGICGQYKLGYRPTNLWYISGNFHISHI